MCGWWDANTSRITLIPPRHTHRQRKGPLLGSTCDSIIIIHVSAIYSKSDERCMLLIPPHIKVFSSFYNTDDWEVIRIVESFVGWYFGFFKSDFQFKNQTNNEKPQSLFWTLMQNTGVPWSPNVWLMTLWVIHLLICRNCLLQPFGTHQIKNRKQDDSYLWIKTNFTTPRHRKQI